AIELEEFRVPAEGVGKNGVSGSITLTTQDFGFLSRRRDDLDHLALGNGPNTLRCLAAPRPPQLRLRKTLGFPALIGLLRARRRKVGPADANVHNPDAERGSVGTQDIGDSAHHRGALLRKRRVKATQAVYPAQRRVETGAQTLFDQVEAAGHRLPEDPGVFDAIGDERVDLVELAA